MEFLVLGPLEVRDEHRVLDIGGNRQRRLLAALLISHGAVVPSTELVDCLWDEAERPPGADQALRTYISRLRRALGAGCVRTVARGYALELDGHALDSDTFIEAARRSREAAELHEHVRAVAGADAALAFWRGIPYADLGEDAWVIGERRRLIDVHHAIIEDRFDSLLALGRHREIVGELERACADEPGRDRRCGQLMVALARSGRQADALRTYQRHRDRLGELFGLEPGSALRGLERRVARADEAVLTAGLDGGRALRSYRLIERVGEGSLAIAWRAEHPSLGRQVAIKQIRPELADLPEFIRAFEAEARLVAHLEHPHIVPLHDFWREPSAAYLVLRWMAGGSLRQRLEHGPLTLAQCSTLVEQVGGALAFAHRHGIVHRTVRAANIFLDEAGNFFLGDFGIAHRAAAQLTDDAEASSDPRAERPDGAVADVQGLGAVVLEALTDRHAERATLVAGLPKAVADLLDEVSAPDPAHPLRSATGFVAAFQVALGAPPRPLGPGGRRDTDPDDVRTDGTAAHDDGAPGDRGSTNPYKGLRAFDEVDAEDFAGRDRLVGRLVQRLHEPGPSGRFVAVVGPSGSGKSSLVRAGLVPALRRGAVPGSDAWFVTALLPGEHPLDELDGALDRIATVARTPGADHWADDGALAEAVRAIAGDDREVLLVVDQFEELFTLCPDEADRRRFIDLLAAAAAAPDSRLRVVVAMRADFWDRPLRYARLATLLDSAVVTVGPMGAEEIERAVVEPARRVGCRVEPALVAALVEDALDQPAALPTLQFALTTLYEERAGDVLSMDAYHRIGGLAGAISRRADQLVDRATAREQRAVRMLLCRLVSLGEGVDDTRRRVLRSELDRSAATSRMIDRFADARLLTFDHDPATREPTIEVAHEALIQRWARLRSWLDEDREVLRTHRSLTTAAAAWLRGGRDPSELYGGAKLEAAQILLDGEQGRLNELERSFLTASLHRRRSEVLRERRRLRRLRTMLVMTGTALVVAVLAGLLAGVQQRRAQHSARLAAERALETSAALAQANAATAQSEVSRLLAESRAVTPTDHSLGLLLALEADRRSPSRTTEEGVLSSLLQEPRFLGRLPGSDRMASVFLAADGTVTGVRRVDGAVRRWDLATRQLLGDGWTPAPIDGVFTRQASTVHVAGGTIAFGGRSEVALYDVATGVMLGPSIPVAPSTVNRWTPVALDPGGLTVYIGGGEGATAGAGSGTVTAYDVRSGLPVGPTMTGPTARVRRIVPSPDGSRVAAGSYDGTVRIWEVSTGALLLTVDAPQLPIGLAWSPDGRRLAWAASVPSINMLVTVVAGVIDAESGRELARLADPASAVWAELDFAPDGDTVYVLDGSGTLRTIPVGTPGAMAVGPTMAPIATAMAASSVVAGPDDDTVLAAGDEVTVWSAGRAVASGRAIAATAPAVLGSSRDGALLGVGDLTEVRILDSTTLEPVTPPLARPDLPAPAVVARPFGFRPDGAQIAVGGAAGSVQLYDLPSGTPGMRLFDASLGLTASIAYSQDGTMLAVGGGGVVVLFDAATGARLGAPIVLRVNRFATVTVAFTPSGLLAASAWVIGQLVVLRPRTGEVVARTERPFSGAFFSPSGAALAVGTVEGTIEVLDAETLEPSGEPHRVFDGAVTFGGFDRSERRLAAVGDRRARIVELADGHVSGPAFPVATNGPAVFLDDGRALAMPRELGGATVWAIDPHAWRDAACRIAGRNLSAEEQQLYLPGAAARSVTCPQWAPG